MAELQTIWGWQPALYLFLGGLGAGTFLVCAIIHLATRNHKRVVCIGMWSATFFLAIGLGLLLTELSAPLRALMMWKSFSHLPSSWMAIGAWMLFAGIVLFALSAISQTKRLCDLLNVSDDAIRKMKTLCPVIGAVLALGIAAYTGVLLRTAPGVPFWNADTLPVLFTVSALDTGVAYTTILLVMFDSKSHSLRYKLELCTIVLILAEIATLILFLTFMLGGGNEFFETLEIGYRNTAASAAQTWLTGSLAAPFWTMFVSVGLIAPFAIALYSTISSSVKHEKALAITSACCVLVGGCTLRFITLLAGAHVDIIINFAEAMP